MCVCVGGGGGGDPGILNRGLNFIWGSIWLIFPNFPKIPYENEIIWSQSGLPSWSAFRAWRCADRLLVCSLFVVLHSWCQRRTAIFDLGTPWWSFLNEPSHDFMVLFVLRKLIFQTRMRSHPVGLDVWFLVGPIVYSLLHVCEQRRLWWDCTDAQTRLSIRYVISTISSWAGSNNNNLFSHNLANSQKK